MTKCCHEEWKGSDVRQIWIGSILLSTALCSSAATLGRHSGAVVIGRSLDIKVQAMAGADEDLGSQCAHAEVLFGDNQVAPSSVRTSVQRNAPDAEASIRVQTTVPVNEPIVSVVVKVGCASPFSRRYVLLADLLSEPAPVAAGARPETSPVASANPADLRALPPLKASPTLRAPRAGNASTGSPANGGAKPEGPASAAPARAKPQSLVRREEAPKETGPRLHLDPVDVSLGIERDPALRLSLALLSEPTSNEQERAAAAQLWKALNASPEDILRDAQKLSVLEAESKGLREQEAKNKAAIQAMEAEVEKSRYMTWLAYLLGGLLLLSLAGVFWMWKRRSVAAGGGSPKDWWAAGGKNAVAAGAAAKNPGKAPRSVDLDLDLGDESGMDDLQAFSDDAKESEAALLTGTERREFRASQMGISRSVATEELFDVQQQSDFFVSLGEFDQAIGVLKNHISESQEPSALAYLDLFKLYHRLDRRADYDKLRAEFNQKFNAGAPPFEQYSDSSRGLESYETAFGRIQALWPQPRVLDVIENSIFRDASDGEAEVFDLEAYRELLLLHAIAKEVIKRDAGLGASDFQHTSIRPLKAAGPKVAAAAAAVGAVADRNTQPLDDIPHASPRLGLDVDLDALQEASAFEASLPEVAVPVEQTAKVVSPHASASGDEAADGNLIDFEILDFMPPEEPAGKGG